jgi:hypothetical protein
MTFNFSFRVDPEGMTVPYPPRNDEIRRNRGFVDLRGRPDKANEIVEGTYSPALRNLLVRIAKAGSPVFTIGCDLGEHQEPTSIPARRREVAGGYIQIASIRYHRAEPESYSSFANAIRMNVNTQVGRDHWKIQCIGKWVDFKFDGEPQGLRPSLWIGFFAAASDQFGALQSRERLIEAVDLATALPDTLASFASVAS